jgi:hypothetical protein
MKILIYVPLAPNRPRIYARTITSLFTLNYKPYVDIVFGKQDEIITSDHNHDNKYANIRDKHNHARDIVLNNDYDAVLFVENDMIIPEDALDRLLEVNADVAYGLYISRHGWRRWLAFKSISDIAGVSFSNDPQYAKQQWGNVVTTEGVGMGCTLIKRNVLERISFRTHPENLVADDWMFAIDCKDNGFIQKHHLGVVCGHITPTGEILWPTNTNDTLHMVDFLDTSNMVLLDKNNPLVLDVGRNGIVVNKVI